MAVYTSIIVSMTHGHTNVILYSKFVFWLKFVFFCRFGFIRIFIIPIFTVIWLVSCEMWLHVPDKMALFFKTKKTVFAKWSFLHSTQLRVTAVFHLTLFSFLLRSIVLITIGISRLKFSEVSPYFPPINCRSLCLKESFLISSVTSGARLHSASEFPVSYCRVISHSAPA